MSTEGSNGANGADLTEDKASAAEQDGKVADLESRVAKFEETISGLTKDLGVSQTEKQMFQERLQKVESGLLADEDESVVEDPSSLVPPTPLEKLSRDDLSKEGLFLLSSVEERIGKLEASVEGKAKQLESKILTDARSQAEVAQIKLENPDTYEIIRPFAVEASGNNTKLSVREAWDVAAEKMRPLLEAKATVDAQRKKAAEAAASEKPGGPTEGTVSGSAKEAFSEAYDEFVAGFEEPEGL